MAERRNAESIDAELNQVGLTRLSEFVNTRTKMLLRCSEGHTFERHYNGFLQTSACPTCNQLAKQEANRQHIQNTVNQKGFTLLSDASMLSDRILVKCDKGHVREQAFKAIQSGYGCLVCRCSGNTLEDLIQYCEDKGYSIDVNDKDTHARYLITCPNGHKIRRTMTKFIEGNHCKECSNPKPNTERVRLQMAEHGLTLISEYVTQLTKLKFTCSAGHVDEKTYHQLKHDGFNCKFCMGRKTLISDVRKEFELEDYILLSTGYVDQKTRLDYICPKNHRASVTYTDWKHAGARCPYCAEFGFNPDKPAIVYYLRFKTTKGYLYKVGITNNTVAKRFVVDPTPYKIITQMWFPKGEDARNLERLILSKYKKWRYKGDKVLIAGNTEMFIKDVLDMDL